MVINVSRIRMCRAGWYLYCVDRTVLTVLELYSEAYLFNNMEIVYGH
jgi:hypothetical protein